MVKAAWRPSYPAWFAKDVWEVQEAEYLILGFEPTLIGKPEFRQTIESHSFDGTTRVLRRQLIRQVWHSLNVTLDMGCPPHRIAQWVEDSGYPCDQSFYDFITDAANNIDYKDNSWIDLGYADWAKKEAWTLDEATDLLAGFTVGKDLERENCDSDRHSRVHDALMRGMAIGTLNNLAIKEGEYLFEPKSLIEWAKGIGIIQHPKLLQCFRPPNAVVANKHSIDLIKYPGTSLNVALRDVYYDLSNAYTQKVKNNKVIVGLYEIRDRYPTIQKIERSGLVEWKTVENETKLTDATSIKKTLSRFRKELRDHGLEA